VRIDRKAAEQRSAVVLLYLRGLPRWLPPVLLVLLLVAGLAVRGWGGAVALCLVAAFLGWLAFLSWPRLAAGGRLARAAVIALLLAVAAFQASR
jgi:O-antigen ligase